MNGLECCIAELRSIVGRDHVLSSPAELADWNAATFPWPAAALAVVRPGSADDVAACLAAAARHRTPVHPLSRGRAWGLASRLPVRDALVLELSRLDRIPDIDPVTGTVRIETGVTFRQLERALAAAAPQWQLPTFGGPPDASVLANALDRGEGSGHCGDRFAQMWDYEVVLATGERIVTGWSRHGSRTLAATHARPAGPLIEGLFSQSGFGCVVSARLALAPRPARTAMVLVEVGAIENASPAVDALRRLLAERIVDPHDAYLWDGAKRLSARHVRSELAGYSDLERHFSEWAACIGVSGATTAVLDAKLAALHDIVAQAGLTIAHELHEEANAAAFADHRRSDGRNLVSCYWAMEKFPARDVDPDRDGCGFLWICPVLPLDSKVLEDQLARMRSLADKNGVFLATGLEPVSHRAVHVYASLAWKRGEADADRRAACAHDAIFTALAGDGYLPYRHTLMSIAKMPTGDATWRRVASRLRAALDPQGILAPGRVPGLD